MTNTHDDTAGLPVIQSGNATDEAGNQTAFFTLALASELVAPATITPHTSDARERALGSSKRMVAQKVVVSGVDHLRRLMASGADWFTGGG